MGGIGAAGNTCRTSRSRKSGIVAITTGDPRVLMAAKTLSFWISFCAASTAFFGS